MVEHTLTLGLVLPLKNIFNVRNEFFSWKYEINVENQS
jgi:hypothetical protein